MGEMKVHRKLGRVLISRECACRSPAELSEPPVASTFHFMRPIIAAGRCVDAYRQFTVLRDVGPALVTGRREKCFDIESLPCRKTFVPRARQQLPTRVGVAVLQCEELNMPDDRNNIGSADRNRINLSEEYEIRVWTKSLGVSEGELREAVDAVGNSVDSVRAYLK